MQDGKVCTHCLLGIVCLSLYGKFRVYECEKGIEYMCKDLLAGFVEPCDGYHCGYGKRGEKWRPKYKRIHWSEMRKSEDCIQDEKEDTEKRHREAEQLRKEAMDLMVKAKELEKSL